MPETVGSLAAARRLAAILALAFRTGWRGRAVSGADADRIRMLSFREACGKALVALGMKLDVRGTPPRGVALIASNHLSYLDPVAIGAIVPCVPISKLELASWPIFGAVAKSLGVLFVERGNSGSRFGVLRAAEDTLRSGRPVLNFPEGTTSDGRRVLPLRPGLFGSVQRMSVPVVPVTIRYEPRELAWTGDATFVPHFLKLVRTANPIVRLTFGEKIASHEYSSGLSLAAAVHAKLSELLEGEVPWRKIQP